MNKEVMLFLHIGGGFVVSFSDENDYKIFKKEKSLYVGMFIAIFVTFFISILLVVLMLKNSGLVLYFAGSLLLIVLESKIFNSIERRYNYYKYDLIIKEVKKKKYRLEYSNDRTGHIRYSKNGEGHSIYVFKGKNAKSAR